MNLGKQSEVLWISSMHYTGGRPWASGHWLCMLTCVKVASSLKSTGCTSEANRGGPPLLVKRVVTFSDLAPTEDAREPSAFIDLRSLGLLLSRRLSSNRLAGTVPLPETRAERRRAPRPVSSVLFLAACMDACTRIRQISYLEYVKQANTCESKVAQEGWPYMMCLLTYKPQ